MHVKGVILKTCIDFQPDQKVYRYDDETVYLWDKPYKECDGEEGDLQHDQQDNAETLPRPLTMKSVTRFLFD